MTNLKTILKQKSKLLLIILYLYSGLFFPIAALVGMIQRDKEEMVMAETEMITIAGLQAEKIMEVEDINTHLKLTYQAI